MFIILIRTILLFVIVIFSLRIMGKRQIGQLQPYELVVAIMISELASLPMQDTRIPLIHGIIPILTLLLIEILIAFIQLKSQRARTVVDGKPSVVICRGKLVKEELRKQLFTVNDLMEELRIKGYFSIDEIEFAILETCGEISIIPKGDVDPATKKDLNIQSPPKTFPAAIIVEGKINYENLSLVQKDMQWLETQLKNNNIQKPQDVFLAIMDTSDQIFIQTYNDRKYNIGEVDI